MRLVGFNFSKINVEKTEEKAGSLKINTNIDIKDISKINSDFLKTKEELLGVTFRFVVDYDPKVAKIELSGNVIFSLETKLIKEILNQWEEKKIHEDFKVFLFNIVLRKSNLKALQLEEELNLPLHINLPSVKKADPKEEKE